MTVISELLKLKTTNKGHISKDSKRKNSNGKRQEKNTHNNLQDEAYNLSP